MTAKEIAEKSVVHEAKNLYFDLKTKGWFYAHTFTNEEFETFCEQLCKEQREICAEAWYNSEDSNDLSYYYNLIKNAPAPEL